MIRFLKRLLKSILNFLPHFVFHVVNIGCPTCQTPLDLNRNLMFCLSKKRNQFIQNIRGNITSVQQSNETRMKNKIKFIYQLLLIIQVCPSEDWYEGGVKYLPNISKYFKYWPNISNICQIFQILARTVLYLSSQPSSPWTLGRKKSFRENYLKFDLEPS